MDAAKQTARLGVVAFSVGLGLAVATGGGIGVAQAASGDSSSASSSADSSDSTPDSKAEASSSESESGTVPGKRGANKSTASGKPGANESSQAADGDTEEGSAGSGEVGDDETAEGSDTHDDARGGGESVEDAEGVGDETRGKRAERITSTDEETEGYSGTTVQSSTIDGAEAASTPELEVRQAVKVVSPSGVAAQAPSDTAVEAVAAPVVAAAVPMVVPRVLSMEGSTLSGDGPARPTPGAVLMAVLDAVRREIKRFFFNTLPTPDPRQIVVSGATGVVFGTLNTADSDGDALLYTVTGQPKNGTITINPDGTYVYMPKAELLVAGGQCGPTACFDAYKDSFTFKVEDRGFNLRRLVSLFTGLPTAVSRTVEVDVPATSAGAGGALHQTFRVYNATRNTVTISTTNAFTHTHIGGINTLSAPTQGMTLAPGEFHEYQVIWWPFHNTGAEATYTSTDGSAWRTVMQATLLNDTASRCNTDNAACSSSGDTIILLENPGAPSIEIPAGQGQQQADVLNKMCGGGIATCSFKVGRKEVTYAPSRAVWDYTTTENPANLGQKVKIVSTSSNSVELSAKAGINIKQIVTAEISTKYSQTWLDSHEEEKTISQTVRPFTHFILHAETPVLRYHGDFTVKIGNTTWILRGIYFDTPDPTRVPRYREETRKAGGPAVITA